VIVAPTEELRKFALEHVNDEKAFSFTEHLVKEQWEKTLLKTARWSLPTSQLENQTLCPSGLFVMI